MKRAHKLFGLVVLGLLCSGFGEGYQSGSGLPSIKASGSVLASSAAATTVVTFTPGSTGFYRISGMFDCTAFTSGTLMMTLAYTDGNSNAHAAYNLVGELVGSAGTQQATLGATGALALNSTTIYAKGGVAITVASAISATATGDFEAVIEQVQ